MARVSFQQQIKSADAVSLRHPEYNRSVPGAPENAPFTGRAGGTANRGALISV
jgi:hypothetical protein